MAVYRFIAGEKATSECSWTIAEMCRTLEVSRSGFYDWVNHEPSSHALDDATLAVEIEAIWGHRTGRMGHRGCIGGCAATALV
jgi:putative transposase